MTKHDKMRHLSSPTILRRTFLLGCGALPALGAPRRNAPAGTSTSAYSLAASPEGGVYLTWVRSEGGGHALRISRLEEEGWSEPRTIAEGGAEWFVNALDHPAVAAGPDGRLMVSWLVRPEAARGAKYGYGVRMAHSSDHGRTWRQVYDAGADNVTDYTGFVGFSIGADGFHAAYLAPLAAGPEQHDAAHVKTLRFAEFSLEGELLSDDRLDADVCTCCPLATTLTADGPAVVYRDHAAGEIRDISIVRRVGGKWTEPRPVHRDGWKINGCPGNGAAIQAEGRRVAVAWFTAAGGEPKVMLATSDDAGATFADPVRVDAGSPVGWASVAMMSEGRMAVSWLEKAPEEPGEGDVMLRIFDGLGRMEELTSMAVAPAGRAAGIPQMVRSGEWLVFAWRDEEQVQAMVYEPRAWMRGSGRGPWVA